MARVWARGSSRRPGSAQERRRHVYVLSRNPQVVGWMCDRGMTVNGRVLFAPLPVQWYMPFYMASRHRSAEGFRKRREIQKCPPLLQGIKRFA